MRSILLAGLAALTLTGATAAANAQAICREWIGKTPAFVTMDSVAKRFGTVKPKDEFESTAEFTARMRALASPSEVFVFEKPLEDPKYLAYNADERSLTIESFAFDNTNLYWDGFFQAVGNSEVKASSYGNVAVALRMDDKTVGTYEAQTAMGVRFPVAKIDRVGDGLFEGPMPAWPDSGFMPIRKLETIPMTPDEARALKSTARAAWVFSPRPPFYLSGDFKSGVTSLSNPREIRNRYRVAIGRLDCALLLDGAGKVFRAYETRMHK